MTSPTPQNGEPAPRRWSRAAIAPSPSSRRKGCSGSSSGSGSGRSSTPTGSMMVTSASVPGLRVPRSMPRMRAGQLVSFSMSCGQVRWPGSISDRMQIGKQRLQADDADGGLVQLADLFSGACGAWSLAITSRVPSLSPAIRACTSSWVRSGGFILKLLSKLRRHLSVRVKWCGQTSPLTRTPRWLAAADQIDAAGGGNVQDVQPAAGQLGQRDVAVDHDFLGGGRHAAQPQAACFRSLRA